jgi:citrate/tricarballylate utilization protein
MPSNTDDLVEANRLMTVCNSCRYCEGLCAVFPAMELRRAFNKADLNYLANLCHSCGACYIDCQFSPPHEFEVNVPATLAKVRNSTYAQYAWPPGAKYVFRHNAIFAFCITLMAVAVFLISFGFQSVPSDFYGMGAFYKVLPHNVMASLFGGIAILAVFALAMGMRNFGRDSRSLSVATPSTFRSRLSSLKQATKDAAQLRYLDGGGAGCPDPSERADHRRVFHHLTAYGFGLCFLATCVATGYHYVLHREAPYAIWDLPVVLGSVGGLGLVVGPLGLLVSKVQRDRVLADQSGLGAEIAFLLLLLSTSLSGLALLAFRSSQAMPTLLAVHLGIVFALFVTMPYGKFVHGLYRFAALVIYARERASLD